MPKSSGEADSDTRPVYKTPAHGILPLVPPSWIPYVELTRLHKPIGILVIYLPYLLGSLFAATIQPTASSSTMISIVLNLFFASIILRSAGCTWNDVVDHKLDQQVARCRLRPVARGAVSPWQGAIFFVVQMSAWIAVLEVLYPRSLPAAATVVPWVVGYPYAKRFTDYPQLVLGATLAWGLFPGWVVGLGDHVFFFGMDDNLVTVALPCLFVAYVAWTVIYDTIYAFQDVQDDIKSGIRSMAVGWRNGAKKLLAVVAFVQVAALGAAGLVVKAHVWYFLACCGGSVVVLGTMIWRVDLQDEKGCGWWFRHGILQEGGVMMAGIIAELVTRTFLA